MTDVNHGDTMALRTHEEGILSLAGIHADAGVIRRSPSHVGASSCLRVSVIDGRHPAKELIAC
jgi:hypothetical protein